MLKTASSLVAAAIFATMPTLTVADSTAVSLGVSLDDELVTSVAVAAAFGDFAVASSVANANSAGAAAGASDDAAATPTASVTYNGDANAYETNVTFASAGVADDGPQLSCQDVLAAASAAESGDLSAAEALFNQFGFNATLAAAVECGLDLAGLGAP